MKVMRICVCTLCLHVLAGSVVGQEDLWSEQNVEAVTLFGKRQYDEAIAIAQQALKTAEATFEPEDHRIAASLNNLAALYRIKGKAGEAADLFQRAINIWSLDPTRHETNIRTAQKNLIAVYKAQGRYSDARALASLMNRPTKQAHSSNDSVPKQPQVKEETQSPPAEDMHASTPKEMRASKPSRRMPHATTVGMVTLGKSVAEKLSRDERNVLEALMDKAIHRISSEHRERMYALHELYRGERGRDMSREEVEELRNIHNQALNMLSKEEKKTFHQLVLRSETRALN